MEKKPFYSLLNRPVTQSNRIGSKEYNWSYLDPVTKELKSDKKNVYDQVQSYARQVDYSTRIYKDNVSKGEINKNGENNRGLYVDISKFGSDYNSLNKYLDDLASLLKNQTSETNTSDTQNRETQKSVGETQPKGVAEATTTTNGGEN